MEELEKLQTENKTLSVWIEAITDQKHGNGVRAKVVNFETASRNGRKFYSRICTATALLNGQKVLISAINKKSALSEALAIKEEFKLDNLKIKHQYIKHTAYIYQNELSQNPIVSVKTSRKYSGVLIFLQ